MGQYRKKPVVIDAWYVADLNHSAARHWYDLPESIRVAYETGGWVFGVLTEDGRRGISVPTLEGPLFAAPGDWIIRGVQGEFYPCKPDVFEVTYEPVERGEV